MPEWTENQKQAIYHHGHDILVSAAAGSGKTTILIERIMELLKNNENVDNLLVATFTDAAAQEMKDRLVNRIKEMVSSDELDADQKRHMQSQIYKVASANISTLHAFCLSVIQKYYYVIDLDPNFRLLSDDTERTLLQESAFDNVRNQYYQNADLDFIELTDNFSNDKGDDGLADTIFRLYDFAITNEKTDEWLDNLTKSYQLDNASLTQSSFFQKSVKPQVENDLKNVLDEMISLKEIAADDTLSQNYQQVFEKASDYLKSVLDDLANNRPYDQIREKMHDFKFERAKALPKEVRELSDDKTIQKSVTAQKTDLKKKIDVEIYENYFIQKESAAVKTIEQAQKLITKLVEVERAFIKEFARLKTDGHTLDFNDLEHKANEILSKEVDGQNVALNYYQHKFHEIMIDEYQDVNAMQENLIQKLSNDDNHIFMVGDIKQSIYGFRQAAPYIFTGKYQKFQEDDNPDELIQLSKNFRSSVSVDDFVNHVFERILDEKIGDIKYDKSVQLIPGTNFPEDIDDKNELYILDQTKSADDTEIDSEQNFDKRIDKIQFAAKRIQSLIDNDFQVFDAKKGVYRTIKYSDIAILSRKKTGNTDLISYFSKAEIPVMVTDAQNYFQTIELQIMMSMLQIIDNPKQDIPLVAVLRSPIVSLNEQDLAEIRLANMHDDYFSALNDFIADEKSRPELVKKLQNFLAQLENYRDFANKNSLVRLIWRIYQDTGILEYVSGMPGGKQRAANLHALYQRADSYEKNNFMGLHKFIAFIQRMQDLDRDLSQPNSIETTDDSVKVMTIHASKGLEFPVVILLNIDDTFNDKDYNSDTLYDTQAGIGITVLNPETRAYVRTLQRSLISDKKQVATVSEEMRLLYVALTRAKQKLIMIGSTKDESKLISNWEHVREDDTGVLNEGARLNAKSYQNLIGMSLLEDKTTNFDLEEQKYITPEIKTSLEFVGRSQNQESKTTNSNLQTDDNGVSDKFKQTVDSILNLDYPFQQSVDTTAYQSVSEIKGLFADPDDDDMARSDLLSTSGRYVSNQFGRPNFLAQSKTVSATDIGSATHLVLQNISLETQPDQASFSDLIEQMVTENVLDPEVGKRIDITSLVNFYQSKLGQMIISNKSAVDREFPFSLLMPADRLFKSDKADSTNDDKILVHGIIDGVLELADGIIVFDYKTDNVDQSTVDQKVHDYSGQLNLYADAISLIKHKKVIGKYLYFLKINQEMKLD